jgi:hypothetical protein
MADLPDDIDVTPDNEDRVAEYFELKEVAKTLRADRRDLKQQHPDYEELQKVKKEAKRLRDNIKNSEDILIIKEKLSQIKERMGLIKEIILNEMIESDQEEVKKEDRKLKIVPVLKDVKAED